MRRYLFHESLDQMEKNFEYPFYMVRGPNPMRDEIILCNILNSNYYLLDVTREHMKLAHFMQDQNFFDDQFKFLMQDKKDTTRFEIIYSPRDLLKTFNFGKPKPFAGTRLRLRSSKIGFDMKKEKRNLDCSRIIKVMDIDEEIVIQYIDRIIKHHKNNDRDYEVISQPQHMKKIEMKLLLGGVTFAESNEHRETIYFYKGKDSKQKSAKAEREPIFHLNDGSKIIHYQVKESFKRCDDDLVLENCRLYVLNDML